MSQVQKMNTMMIPLIMGLLAATFCGVVKSDPNTNVVSLICNVDSYAAGNPFADSVAYVLVDLMNVTPTHQDYDYSTVSPYPTAVAYGHSTCSQYLANSECANCLVSAKASVTDACNGRIGGQVQLGDCTMRFENYTF